MAEDIKTQGIILRRTNYGEADRILNIITPSGKISAIAKGVRRPRSKLAGGVETFTLSDLQIHLGRSDLGVVTGARMCQHYRHILEDYERMTLAGLVLKRISAASEHSDTAEWFNITQQVLSALNTGMSLGLVEAWFWLNLLKSSGEEVNLYRDITGRQLEASQQYEWDIAGEAFTPHPCGRYGANEIKLLRLMTGMGLTGVGKIRSTEGLQGKILEITRIMAKN